MPKQGPRLAGFAPPLPPPPPPRGVVAGRGRLSGPPGPSPGGPAGRGRAGFLPPAAADFFRGGRASGGSRGWPRGRWGHVAGLDRRQRPVLGPAHARHLRRLRPAEDHLLAPVAQVRAATAGTISASSTSPASSKATGPDPKRFGLWLDKRGADCPPDPFANEASTRAWPSARAARTCRSAPTTASPRASWACGCSRTPTSTRRRRRSGTPERFYNDPTTTTPRTSCGPTGSACRAASATSARARSQPPADPENPKWENLSSTVGAQYFWSTASSPGRRHRSRELHVPAGPHLAAGHARHLAGLDRQHQQPAHDERGLQPRAAAGDREALGQGERWPGASWTTSSSTTSSPTGRSPSSSAPDTSCGRRACSRTAPTRWARSARSTASTSTSASSARSGCCTSARSSAASRSRRSRSPTRRRTPSLLAGDRGADAEHGAVLPQGRHSPTA